jgi:hemerythrin-like domain-containing protein
MVDMQRDPRLQALSGDHRAFVQAARRARLAAGDPDEARTAWLAVKRQFAAQLKPHLKVEEEVLFPALSQAGERDLVALAQADHAALRSCLEGDSDPAASLRELAEALESHVAFDEQTLFETAEARLDEPTLAKIAAARGRTNREGPQR